MLKKQLLTLCHCFLFMIVAHAQKEDLVPYVNPLMGTLSKPDLSNGNTYPAISTPWAMNMWTPQTGNNGDGWQYTYTADKIKGFKQTHQPSPWMNDYGVFSIMPITGKAVFKENDRASWFSHKSETAQPDYYSVYLADYNVTTEITPTERAAIFRMTFHAKDSAYVVVDAFDRGSYVKIIPEENKIVGYTTRYARGKMKNFANYFVITFNTPFTSKKVWQNDTLLDSLATKGNHSGAIVGFNITQNHQQVIAKVASSFISIEQAEYNLKMEVGDSTFDAVRTATNQLWNDVLGKVTLEGGTETQKKTFYSCLYRAALFPNKLYEKAPNGALLHYSPYNGKVMPGYLYGGTGFWDTFRALYPLLNLLYPAVNTEMQEGLLNDYKEGGFLPEWSSPGYADIMIGNNSASVVADAAIKGLKGYDINTLYQALQHGAQNEGPIAAVGRYGVSYYNALGYVPYDVNINENVARTLEYAYDDFTIFKLAQQLNRPKAEVELYAQRSLNYRNVFDPETKLMRGKNKDGQFQSPFNPLKWGDAFTEGNSWHYTWSVFHDINGLANLMGGKAAFAKKLDTVFELPPTFDASYYGGTIHEITEMQIANMGQYAHGNQPIQHMIYLYNYAEQSFKSQYWVRETMNRMYQPTPDGYCGDEDNGQTSAWYVFSALGFYPVCPGTEQYVIGAPLFKKATLHLDGGTTFVINAPNNSLENKYIGSQNRNGFAYTKTWLSHSDILKGGTFDIAMQSQPDTTRTTTATDLPYSFSKDEKALYDKVKTIQPMSSAAYFKSLQQPITITKKGLTLVFDDAHKSFTKSYRQRFVEAFFMQYPKLLQKYNPNSAKKVTFIIDIHYKGVAETTSDATIRYNPEWFVTNPEDMDVVTHELMHIVQGYSNNDLPSWITEGIADYVRATEGFNNTMAKWSLPRVQPQQKYTNSYRITARFFLWITQKYDPNFVILLNAAARQPQFDTTIWKTTTGKTLDELWQAYLLEPTIQ